MTPASLITAGTKEITKLELTGYCTVSFNKSFDSSVLCIVKLQNDAKLIIMTVECCYRHYYIGRKGIVKI